MEEWKRRAAEAKAKEAAELAEWKRRAAEAKALQAKALGLKPPAPNGTPNGKAPAAAASSAAGSSSAAALPIS